ncbi:MAG: T9SS type A sorting domain-containing protein [Bacteroidota bacterium]|nr:T9SS type A sorting domain-containing protein [Bacteroidota bacterium]
MRRFFVCMALVMFVTASRAQQQTVRLPQPLKGVTVTIQETAPLDMVKKTPAEPAGRTVRKAPAASRSTANTGFEIGRMANTFATIGQNRNQIACDPSTNMVVVIHRSNEREGSSVGDELIVRRSTDHGSTWGAPSPNVANTATPRYPNIFLYNPTKSTNPADVKVAILWPQVVTYPGTSTWGEVNSLQTDHDLTGKVYAKFPTPPNWQIPEAIMASNTAGRLYTVCDAVEPSNGQSTGQFFFFMSTNGGASWQLADPNVVPMWDVAYVPEDERVYNLCSDVSPDGSRAIFAYIAGRISQEGSMPYISTDHAIAYFESTDGGLTWPVQPTYISIADIPDLPSPLNVNAGLGIAPQLSIGDLDVVYDKYNEPHFLVTVSTDNNPYNPLASGNPNTGEFSIVHVDSTFLCEVGRKGTDYYLNLVAQLRTIRGFRYSYVTQSSTGAHYPETIYHEPHWAINLDADKIYAKWVEVDSTLKFPYAAINSQNQLVLFQDTIRNAWVAGRHVDSRGNNCSWTTPMKITSNTDVDVKYTKMAHFAGNDGELHIIYTEWGLGERPDDDPNLTDNILWYIQGVKIEGIVAEVEKVSEAPGDFSLAQNYPNPFNPSTTITFTLPTAGRTALRVYNALGREVATVFDRELSAGTHRVVFDARNLPSGVYLYKLESGTHSATRSMTLIK